ALYFIGVRARLGIWHAPRSTAKGQKKKLLNQDESERVLAVTRLVGQAESIFGTRVRQRHSVPRSGLPGATESSRGTGREVTRRMDGYGGRPGAGDGPAGASTVGRIRLTTARYVWRIAAGHPGLRRR